MDHPLQRGGGVGDDEDEDLEESLEELVCPPTGHEVTDEYGQVLQRHGMAIEDNEVIKELYKTINRQITPFFTYQNPREMILREIEESVNGQAFKINLRFGFILYHKITGDYRYYFPSSNSLLFDRAMTITCVGDIDRVMKKILDLDLVNNYRMSRPSSSWTMAGLPNIQLSIFYLPRTLIG